MHAPIAHDFDIRDLTQHDPVDEKPFFLFLKENQEKLSGRLILDLTFYLTGITMTKEASDEYMRHSMVGLGSKVYETLSFIHRHFFYMRNRHLL